MKGVKINVRHMHAPSFVLGAVGGCVAGGILGYLLLRNRVQASADAEIESVRQHYRLRADADLAKLGTNDSGYLAYRAGLARAAELGYGDPSGEYGPDEDGRVEGEGAGGNNDESDLGSDPAWPGTTEGIRERDGISLSENYRAESSVRSNSGIHRTVAEGSIQGRNRDGLDGVIIWPPADRDESRPFRIDSAEFNEEAYEHYNKISVTYYAGDNVLVDDKDDPIRTFDGITGPLRIEDFGGVSLDPYIQYVRNHKLEADFDIVLNRTEYVEAVLNYGNPNSKKRGEKCEI